ncbi:MAG: secretin N-terminal domain-containing protein [Holosporaceae bacterium]|jgi:general secretion pathway protein D|nr:secretin N-terminal domain-containing protein [Holosporaceae bacterium]
MHFVVFVVFGILVGCSPVDVARTPQQKQLSPKILETISAPVVDFTTEADADDFPEDEIDKEQVIGENFYKVISISATENMKMREVLTQMATLAGINIFIVQDVEGNISFSAKNRPFLDILKDICSGAGLKYSIDGNSVKIEMDTPLLKVYNVQFLNIQRDTQSNVSVSTDIFMNQSMGKGDAAAATGNSSNGSRSFVSGATKNDFWTELEASLKAIVGEDDGSYVSLHRQGGLITIFTTQNKHNEIQKYLKLLKDTSESQVLIEAKILEVNLKDEFKSGINWNIVRGDGANFSKPFSHFQEEGMLSFGVNKNNLNIVTGLIEKFGAVKTLSSPRITVLNNQSAILKVAQNEIIYIPELQRQYATVSDNRSTDFLSTVIHTIPIGLIMSVMPSVDKKNNTILLSVRPTISRIASYKEVPFFYQTTVNNANAANAGNAGNAANAVGQNIQNHKIPIVDVRELDSVLKLRSGQIVVMGGLMQESSSNERDGLPKFSKSDFLLGSNAKTTRITELVIFLRATIIRNKGKAHHEADKKMYKTFANDPRPLDFKK